MTAQHVIDNRFMYLTDDRDKPVDEQRSLVIFPGGNQDWYVQIAGADGFTTEGVRISTSGGAQASCPGLGVAIADAYRAMKASASGQAKAGDHAEDIERMRLELQAWRAMYPQQQFDGVMSIEDKL